MDRGGAGDRRFFRHPDQHRDAAGPGAGELDVGGLEFLGSHRAADVHLDGGDSLSHQIARRHVRGIGDVAAAAARPPVAFNVVGCAIFAAVSGSSAATCATTGRIALPELLKRGYDE
jgi:Tripartite ATP-independent periplasmic transporter, DctM component